MLKTATANKLMSSTSENKFRHVKRGQPCVYKRLTCAFDGGCHDCAVWKKKEIEMLKVGLED